MCRRHSALPEPTSFPVTQRLQLNTSHVSTNSQSPGWANRSARPTESRVPIRRPNRSPGMIPLPPTSPFDLPSIPALVSGSSRRGDLNRIASSRCLARAPASRTSIRMAAPICCCLEACGRPAVPQFRRALHRCHITGGAEHHPECSRLHGRRLQQRGRDDIAIGFADGIAVFRNQGNGTFLNVTTTLGIRVSGIPLGLSFVDYDHDGDLDLYVSRFTDFALGPNGQFDFPFATNAPSNQVWRNNGNGTFTDATEQAGLAGDAPGIGAVAADLDNDRAIDLVLTGWRRAALILGNPREGPFRAAEPWNPVFPSPPAGAVAVDFNKDGWMDLAFTHWGSPGLSLWKNVGGARFERVAIPELQWIRGWGIAAVDVDNDGWLDLAAVGETGEQNGEIRVLRNLGGERFADVTGAAGATVRLERPRALIAGERMATGIRICSSRKTMDRRCCFAMTEETAARRFALLFAASPTIAAASAQKSKCLRARSARNGNCNHRQATWDKTHRAFWPASTACDRPTSCVSCGPREWCRMRFNSHPAVVIC